MYTIRNLLKRYQDRVVLEIERLDIQAGELLAVVGPSGAGKSTLLRLLHFLEKPDDGEVGFRPAGASTSGANPELALRRRIGMVFQRPEMLFGSVSENAAVGLRFRGIEAPERVAEALQLVGLDELKDAVALDLSGGELQRVAIARVLAVRPDVYLFDEPTANLDPGNVGLVENIIRAIKARGATVVLVTHNVFQARRLADRVAFLLGGKLIEVAPTDEFFEHPKEPRSRAFVRGEMVY